MTGPTPTAATAYFSVSEEALIDMGVIEPSAEYLAREAAADAYRRTWRVRWRVLRRRVARSLEFHIVRGPLPRECDE